MCLKLMCFTIFIAVLALAPTSKTMGTFNKMLGGGGGGGGHSSDGVPYQE